MPIDHKNKSILNEEYTEIIKQIHAHLKEAKDLYESLPESLKKVDSTDDAHGGNSLNWYLINGETRAWVFAEGFGIEVER